MKSVFIIGCLSLLTSVASAKVELGIYQNILDKTKCTYDVSSEPEMGGVSYDCQGPIDGTSIYLGTGSDWDNVLVRIGSNSYSLWTQMVAAGAFSGFGNQNGVVEWVGNRVDQGQPLDAIGLIIRFVGVDQNGQALPSKLGVFKIDNEDMCFAGFAPQSAKQNEEARKMVTSGTCIEQLEPQVEEPGIQ